MDFLQWGGALCVIGGYSFMVTYPRLSTVCSLLGCVLCGIWAYLVPAWGVFAIEVFCGGMSALNFYRLTTR